ncbi:MAG: KTSC domain-containing protein [Janthinobacterium lividum]
MQLQMVRGDRSGRVKAIGYDEDTWTCYVQFPATERAPQGAVYAFASVPPEMFDDFQAAPSAGEFFEQHLARKAEHPYVRLQADGRLVEARSNQLAMLPFSSPEEALATAQQIAREAHALEITTPAAYTAAGEELVRLAGERKRRVDFFRPMKEAAFSAHRAVCARENEALAPLRQAERALSEGLVAYRQREEQARKAAQIEWNALSLVDTPGLSAAGEWMPQHMAEAAVSTADLIAAMQPGVAVSLSAGGQPVVPFSSGEEQALTFAAPAVVARDVPAVVGLSFATEWDFEVTEPAQVPLSHEFYWLDERKLRGYVRRLREHASIPGVRVFPKERSRAHAA